MQVSVKNLVIAAVAAAAAIAAAICLLRPSEESRVRAAFRHAAETISKSEGESIIMTATRTNAIADLAEPEISITIPEHGVDAKFTRGEMARSAAAVRTTCASLSVSFESVVVSSIEGNVAHATADVLVSGTGATSFLEGRDTREVEAVLRKGDDGTWRFSKVAVKEIVAH